MLPRRDFFGFATLMILLPTTLATNSKPTPAPGSNPIPVVQAAIVSPAVPVLHKYVVYGRRRIKPQEVKTVQDLLNSFHPKDSTAVELVSDTDAGVAFWRVELSTDQVTTVKKSALVAEVVETCSPCFDPTLESNADELGKDSTLNNTSKEYLPGDKPLHVKRSDKINRKETPNKEVSFFNWEKGHDLEDYEGFYVYHSSGGRGIPVYIVDSGANLNAKEFTNNKNVASRVRWIFVKKGDTQTDDAPRKHGTCMLSKVAGDTLGIAKKCNPVVVKVPKSATPDEWLEGVMAVNKDLGPKQSDPSAMAKTRVIVSMSFQFPATGKDAVTEAWSKSFQDILNEMERKGAFLVTGSGNKRQSEVTGYPAVFAVKEVPSLLVVGASHLDGTPWVHSIYGTNVDKKRGIPSVYAPGYTDMPCAAGIPGTEFRDTDGGTSMATASVAGLAAYFLGMPSVQDEVKTPLLMKKYIENKAWGRLVAPDTHCVWNGISFKDAKGCLVQKRDGTRSCQGGAKGAHTPGSSSGSVKLTTLMTSASSRASASPSQAAQKKKFS